MDSKPVVQIQPPEPDPVEEIAERLKEMARHNSLLPLKQTLQELAVIAYEFDQRHRNDMSREDFLLRLLTKSLLFHRKHANEIVRLEQELFHLKLKQG